MGAESSTLQSIESLNQTLSDIERKLGIVEDIHLHHERNIFCDDGVVVSGRLIKCNANVHLRIGPILGLIGQNFARVLIETNVDTCVSWNLFEVDDRQGFARFITHEVT